MKIFLKKLAGFSIGPVAGAIISLITIPLTTYFISPEEFGKSSMFTIMLSFINIILYLGMDQSFAREYHEVKNKNNLFFNSIIPPVIFSVIICTLLILFRSTVSIALFKSEEYSHISIVLGCMLITAVLERFILMRIRMEEKAIEYSVFSIFVKCTVLFSLVFFIIFFEKNFLIVVYSTIFGQIIGDIYLIIRYRYFFKGCSVENIDSELMKKMLKFGFPLLIAASLNSFLNATGTFSIRKWSTFHELGIFSAGQRISNFLNIIQLAFTSFWIPTAYRWHKENRELKNFKFISDVLLLVMSIGFFIVIFFKNYIVILLSSDYAETKYIIGFLVMVPILYTLSETTTLGIVFSKKSYLNILVSIFSVFPCYILNYYLVPLYGSRGASISIGIAYFLFFITRTILSKNNDFDLKITKHYLVIIVLFIVATLNLFDLKYILLANLIFFILVILIQASVLIDLKKSIRGEQRFDLS
ncbi:MULTISPECIES: oligosaccharide flippase family protein [Vagococcus]|uniref:Polysaccharide biosynthesis protein n=1 Tax=Vagococcus fluvialis bH819 TaxID=1255619 RepID=A0A1X6WLU4_9ENTE|nr:MULTISPECIES: oligosaccharide flippase family protein [Vagococcus]SLM85240.1 hypothetical protein FM121_04030 [Vagococcus fluvialis bH819]HCM89460.1 polysaccharide biosynthesis protein [Vagococcus sp.]